MVAFAVVVAACGDNSVPSIPLGDVQEASREAACTYEVKCGLFPDVDTCVAYTMSLADPNPQAALAAKRLSYSGSNAKQCFDALAAASCDQTQKSARVQPTSCKNIFGGKQAEGQPCAFDDECQTHRCLLPNVCTMACCQATCGAAVAAAQIGQSCASVACVDDAFCDETSTCRALVGNGGACASPDECQYGLGCVGVSPATQGTCAVVPAVGQPCPDGICADIGAVCDPSGTCVALGLPGAPCTLDLDCAPAFHCDSTNYCNPYPTLGMTCTTSCAAGSWCDVPVGQTAGTCTAPLANGQPCQLGAQCASQFCDQGAAPPACADVPVCI
jgi:hypothetical protein